MAKLWARYKRYARRRRKQAEAASKRLDIQGLRMVAVLMVFAAHLWGWPPGGFVGVDVFFVISGFLITGNLLRTAETRGNVSFAEFYWNRVRRIVPAATVVLILTYGVSMLVFLPFRSHQIGIDAVAAFFFMSNWWFGYQGTDYFRIAASTVSPIQHFWSLSIEEQFYFVWPGLIFVIGLVVVRNAWTDARRMRLAGCAMAGIVIASLTWSLYASATTPSWAYFDTFSRAWELGVGALLATSVAALARMPNQLRPLLSWTGLAMIAGSVFLINGDTSGFPAPWALLPVGGAGLVVAAGVGEEPRFQPFLRNPVAGYIGDISYSLYLVHWPVIVILGSLMDSGVHFSVAVAAVGFGLAVASYHFVESPLRKADRAKFREIRREIRRGRYRAGRSTGYAAIGVLTLLIVAIVACEVRPAANETATPPPLAEIAPGEGDPSGPQPASPPLTAELQTEIVAALKADSWPQLNPSIEAVLGANMFPAGIGGCEFDGDVPKPLRCQWGSNTAPIHILSVGDSIALGYAGSLRAIALNSGGRINFHSLAVGSCTFTDDLIERPGLADDCQAKKQEAVDFINSTKPDIVIVSDLYQPSRIVGTAQYMTPNQYADSLAKEIAKFRTSTAKIVLLAPPAGNADIKACYSKRSSTPADCIGRIPKAWKDLAGAEQKLAGQVGGVWIDSRPWFCSVGGLCPAFVGTTPTKYDAAHLAAPYGDRIYSVIEESLHQSGVL